MTVEIEAQNGKKTRKDGETKAEEKAAQVKRKPAPKLQSNKQTVDWRKKKLDDLNAKDDGYEYSYISHNTETWEKEWKGMEEVKDKEGKKLHFKGDPIVRRNKATLDAERKEDAEYSEQQVKDIVKTGRTKVTRNPKRPEG